jgi:SPP1 gp7 family putative phage head morphogenesis protein
VTPRAERLRARRELVAAAQKRRARTLPAATLPHAAVVAHTRLWLDVSRAMDREIALALRDVGIRVDAAEPLVPGPDRVRVVKEIRRRLERLTNRKALVGAWDAIAKRVGQMSERQWHAALAKVGVTPADIGMDAHIERFRRENMKLIRSLSSEKVARVRSVLTEAGVGARPEDIAARIVEETGATESRAATIARTEVNKLYSQVAQARHEAAGITSYQWSAAMDARTRPAHRALNGRTILYADPPVVDEKTGRRAHAGQDISCRCVGLAILPTE